MKLYVLKKSPYYTDISGQTAHILYNLVIGHDRDPRWFFYADDFLNHYLNNLSAVLNSFMISPLALVRVEEQNNLFFVMVYVVRTGRRVTYNIKKS